MLHKQAFSDQLSENTTTEKIVTKPRDIILISGPSGSGKSTLIDQLVNGTLADEIKSQLPEDAGGWPHLEANAVLRYKKGASEFLRESEKSRGIILHYDIAFIHRYHISCYSDDPTMEFFKYARSLHIVFLRPDADKLRSQFRIRREQKKQQKTSFSLWWAKNIRLPVRELKMRLQGKETLKTEELYTTKGWLEECYKKWSSYLNDLKNTTNCRIYITVVPSSDANGAHAFRLTSESETASKSQEK